MPDSLRCKAYCCIHNDNLACRLPAIKVVGESQKDDIGIRCSNYHYRRGHVDNSGEKDHTEGEQEVAFVITANMGSGIATADTTMLAAPVADVRLSTDDISVPSVDCTVGVCTHNKDGRCKVEELYISSPNDSKALDASCLSFDHSKVLAQ